MFVITFSGIDCSGKSTQIDLVKDHYVRKGKKVRVIWSRGGYTPVLETLKTFIRRDKSYTEEQKVAYRQGISNNSKKSRLLLLASIWDLAFYYGVVFRFIEWFNIMIICDRYIWDTYIDFKIKFSQFEFEKWLSWRFVLKVIKKPAISIVFTIPIDISMQRSIEKNDPHSEPYDIRLMRIHNYEEQIKKNRWQYVIDATQSKEDVFKEVQGIISVTK